MGTDDQHLGFDRLIRPHLDRLYRLAWRLTGARAEAEDLFQDVLVKVYPRIEELLDLDDPAPWLSRVMYNYFVDNRRRFRRQRLIAVSAAELPAGATVDDLPGELDPALDAERRDNIMRLHRALATLSDDHRLVVLLHDTEGYKLEEIQQITGIPTGTLKSRLHRARARLREFLSSDGTEHAARSCSVSKRMNV